MSKSTEGGFNYRVRNVHFFICFTQIYSEILVTMEKFHRNPAFWSESNIYEQLKNSFADHVLGFYFKSGDIKIFFIELTERQFAF